MEPRDQQLYGQYSEHAAAYESLLNASLYTLLLGNLPVPGVSILQAMRSPCLVVLAPQVFNLNYLATQIPATENAPDLESICVPEGCNSDHAPPVAGDEDELADNIQDEEFHILFDRQEDASLETQDENTALDIQAEAHGQWEEIDTWGQESQQSSRLSSPGAECDGTHHASQEFGDDTSLWNSHMIMKGLGVYDEPMDLSFEALQQEDGMEGTSTEDVVHDQQVRFHPRIDDNEDLICGELEEVVSEEPDLDTRVQHDDDFSQTDSTQEMNFDKPPQVDSGRQVEFRPIRDSTQGFENYEEWWNLNPRPAQVSGEPANSTEEPHPTAYLGFGSPIDEDGSYCDTPEESQYAYERAISTDPCPWQHNLEEDTDEGLLDAGSQSPPADWPEDAELSGSLSEDGTYLRCPS
ncbi:hypothetical protein CPLU01_04659 [Colletotrichum plurivorum]|uniref:Uncharacterized protein n=1 Tax=Colletotrichum plurivorum TaxID=2175906 RepID=A0A8H6KNX3_9PEZI|nr:hypothetical protein CPLU01_04659 [Colletotrichum plurivorum]